MKLLQAFRYFGTASSFLRTQAKKVCFNELEKVDEVVGTVRIVVQFVEFLDRRC